ncbi:MULTISPECIES: TfoX/Sxy family protein [unclassified Mesorhizobium]|uniref:TfoX/Sxy family protein n=1 Tax=unclassified Mesorhizobium TaxID=325217 RepID=UPI0007003A2C|nr:MULTISPECIES: TfoX/Sxy family protein [unclassified Mesorhizobium]KQZ13100.1 competence protein TfoX [Mesorhizobium sp. Root1471]KQZ35617.1 competence protein TfoX [Mesorhizobium sp. Root554]MDR7031882.1 DNA transformation protein [Mesorhizobium sp. BE184]
MDDERIRELFEGLGSVSIRRMFGGKGIYHNGVIIAVILRDELMLKGDAEIAAEYEEAGAKRWVYIGSRHGKEVAMPYWTAPESALDDPDEMAGWARKAYEAGLRSGK